MNRKDRRRAVKEFGFSEDVASVILGNTLKTIVRQTHKTGRNEPCPCGSNKKYKHCCLATKRYENYIYEK